jgi:hypothetical protein
MTTFEMLKVINFQLAAIVRKQAEEFEHLSTALGDVLRDLDDIKQRLPVRKADKGRRRGVHQSPLKP